MRQTTSSKAGLRTLALIALWYAACLTAVVTVLPVLALGDALPELPSPRQIQVWGWVLSFLFAALVARTVAAPLHVVLIVLAVFALGFAVLTALTIPINTLGWAIACAAAIAFVLFPSYARGVWFWPGFIILAGLAAWFAPRAWPKQRTADVNVMVTAVQSLQVRENAAVIPSIERGTWGGALARMDSGFVLVTGDGRFFRLDWRPDHQLAAVQLPLQAELNRSGYFAAYPSGADVPLRAVDIALDTTGANPRVYLAHQLWNAEGKCLTLRVSVAELPKPGAPGAVNPWSTIFETAPCIAPSYEMRRGTTGARLAWYGRDTLLLSIGDHAIWGDDGLAGAQNASSPYGKILKLHTGGGHQTFSLGHRNPQGLATTPGGEVWSTEHGPQGGDEINFIVAGANYGWPVATYGVQYGQDRWPLAGERRDHAEFQEPAIAFIPSIGISNLIYLDSPALPAWRGDLLVASLRDKSLHRARTRQGRVMYVERIPIGTRIRDLEQGSDGRIVLWTDASRLIALAPHQAQTPGERAYATCAVCHGANLEGTPAGPPLAGIIGRDVASSGDFPYSSAMKGLGGKWTVERLNAFIRNPDAYVPGTTMTYDGADQRTVTDIIEYLRAYEARMRN